MTAIVPKRIVFVITTLGMGGAETQLVRLATGLKGRGWQVSVVSLIPMEYIAKNLEQAQIPAISLSMKPGSPDPRAVLVLARYLREQKPQIVHTHMVHANLLGRVARLLVPVPVLISTAHNVNEGSRWREIAYRLTDPLCDLTTQVSQAGLERYVDVGAVPKDKIRFVPNGINSLEFSPNPQLRARLRGELGWEEQFIWLAVGRFAEAKDYPNMMQAFARVHALRPEARLMIAGLGEQMKAIQQLAQTLGLDQAVRFLGLRKDVAALMNAADGYVMSSAWEGLPMVLLEAASTGLPMVVTDVGGNREVVQEGQTGYLVPPGNPESLSAAMIRLMTLPEMQRQRMGEAAQAFVEQRYSLESVLTQWETIYAEQLRRKGLATEVKDA
ncbi:glycosyltransferase [Meiothermus sp.]|uniref:glycosyltransferase n=1 Tax=Meiothermus sp. TaxID=1955249 RepID=UPI00307DD931